MKRFLQYGAAFIITVVIKATYTFLLFAVAKTRGDTVSLNAHEHNPAIREALSSLHIPTLRVVESRDLSSGPILGVSLAVSISEVASVLVIFFLSLWFVRLMIRDKRSDQSPEATGGRVDGPV